MHILALEPYWGGSHQAFLEGWSSRSSHTWDILTLPPYKWKWRMRHAAITFAGMIQDRQENGGSWDRVFCSDMLNAAEFKGLAPLSVRDLPLVCYFHENQLTYPVRHEDERDYHFVMSNIVSCRAADRIWFNSRFHMESFLDAMPAFLGRMPDYTDFNSEENIRSKSQICYPGIDMPDAAINGTKGPIRILWAARWEHDKNPDDFFKALSLLREQGVAFRLNVIGEQFKEIPAVFEKAQREFSSCIDRWGFQKTRKEYTQALLDSDVIVSTAYHEFFGISIIEAASVGVLPLIPKRLSYPEIFSAPSAAEDVNFFYDGTPEHLAFRLQELAEKIGDPLFSRRAREYTRECVRKYRWDTLAPEYDRLLYSLIM
jgi:glycosyltransferase involved in cell wall biosynthesis